MSRLVKPKPIAFEFKHISFAGSTIIRFEHVTSAEYEDMTYPHHTLRVRIIDKEHPIIATSFGSDDIGNCEEAEEFMKQYREYCGLVD